MGGFAWVTLATNDSYSLGALVLAHSLRRAGTKHDLAVLVTPGVTGAMREKLSAVFSVVQEVNVLDSKDEANLALLARPELGITFTKLHCWRLTQYDKCVFVDADTLVIRNCDELFDREELSAAPDVGWPDCFNSGVFVFKPSQQTFASITSFAAAKGSFDGGDQGLLNQYFSDWSHKDISKHLPFIYNMCSTATYSYLPAFKQFGEDVRIIHFIGVAKPWLQYFDSLTGQVHPAPGTNHLQPLLQLWWNIFCDSVHPQLSSTMASSTLAPLWHEYKSLSQFIQPEKKITSHETIDQTTNDVLSADKNDAKPDFSDFVDPWENYREPTNFHESHQKNNNSTNNSNNNTSNNSSNSNQESAKTNIFSWPSESVKTNENLPHHRKDHNDNHDEPKKPSVLERSGNNSEKNDCPAWKTDFRPMENPSSQCTGESRFFFNDDHEIDDNKNMGKHVVVTEDEKNHEFSTENRQIDEVSHHDPENHQKHHSEHHHHHHHHRHDSHQHHPHHHHHHHHHYRHENEIRAGNEMTICPVENATIIQIQIPIGKLVDNLAKNSHDLSTIADVTLTEDQSNATTAQLSHSQTCTKPKSVTPLFDTSNIARPLESNHAGIAGALANLTLGEARSPEQNAFEEHMRKQSWEQGQIDYMGRDSFDNIWKKISATLSVQSERQPSPPKSVPKPKEEAEAAKTIAPDSPVAVTEEKSPAKVQAAAPSESQEKEEASERELASSLSEETTEKSQPKTSVDDANVAPVSTVPEESSTTSGIESPTSKKKDSTITKIETPTQVPAIPEISKSEEKIAAEVSKIVPEIPESQSDIQIEKSLKVEETLPESSQVPIQVAESVLEAEVKESVSEDLKPVTEEAVSSISLSAQESVPAVLQSPLEPISPADGVDDLCPKIANGIDHPNIACPIVAPIATVVQSLESLAVLPALESQDSSVALEKEVQLPVETQPASSCESLKLQETEAPKETPLTVPESLGKSEISKSPSGNVESVDSTQVLPLSSQDPKSCERKDETKDSPLPVESAEPNIQKIATSSESIETKEKPVEKPEEVESCLETSKTRETPVETQPESGDKPQNTPAESLPSLEPQETHFLCRKPDKSKNWEKSEETEGKSEPLVESSKPEVPKKPEVEGPIACPIKCAGKKSEDLTVQLEKKVAQDSEEAASQPETFEESPIRPARTKDLQIPDTPTIIEATPPTSPPIGSIQNLEEEKTTQTKKVVKKVVKKSTTESKSTEGEPEAEASKKVTKKVVKKVVKKKEDDGTVGEAGGAEKPKKVVKLVKKNSKSSLDAESTVPETPPPGTSDPLPVPPKRKLKTTLKTQKSDSEP